MLHQSLFLTATQGEDARAATSAAIFLLKARRPKKYRERIERKNINTGPNDGAIQVQHNPLDGLADLPREDRQTLREILKRHIAAKEKARLSGEGDAVLVSGPPVR